MKMAYTILVLALLFLTAVAGVYGQEVVTTTQGDTQVQKITLTEPAGILPNSPFYVFDLIFEKIGRVLTLNRAEKTQMIFAQMEERLSEQKLMLELGKVDKFMKAEAERERLEDEAQEMAVKYPELNDGVYNKLEKHIVVLEVFEGQPSLALVNFTNNAGRSREKLVRMRGAGNLLVQEQPANVTVEVSVGDNSTI